MAGGNKSNSPKAKKRELQEKDRRWAEAQKKRAARPQFGSSAPPRFRPPPAAPAEAPAGAPPA